MIALDLNDYRAKIDEIDGQIVALFTQRMDIAAEIAAVKKEKGLPVLDIRREREKLLAVTNESPERIREYIPPLYSLLMQLSRSYQHRIIGTDTTLTDRIRKAIGNTPSLFPAQVSVACQGAEGGDSQIACDRLFNGAGILFFSDFAAVFTAIEKGLCSYGVLPLENSTAGRMNAVYDLMDRHEFSIVRSVRLKDNHFTRFICISRRLEIYPGADHTSLMVTLPNESGSLYRLLSRFNALGINLLKLESRPISGRESEFMFYIDLDTPVCDPAFLQLMGELPEACKSFRYLGSYREVL